MKARLRHGFDHKGSSLSCQICSNHSDCSAARSHGKAGASDEGGGGLIAVCWATSKTPPPRPRMYAAESDPAKALVAAALLAASVASAFVGVKAEHA